MSFRMQMLGGNPRLAHCLSTAAALGGWEGGIAGSGQGLACHSMAGSHIAVLVEASIDKNRLRVGRSEEHTSELQSLMRISYAVFCLKKKNHKLNTKRTQPQKVN